MNTLTQLVRKIKNLLAVRRPAPVPVPVEGKAKNTPWQGNTRSILWTAGGQCRVLQVAS